MGVVPSQNSGRGSHIEAQILLFFKEIVKDEFAHEVWVQRVVYHLGPSELDWGVGAESQRRDCGGWGGVGG